MVERECLAEIVCRTFVDRVAAVIEESLVATSVTVVAGEIAQWGIASLPALVVLLPSLSVE